MTDDEAAEVASLIAELWGVDRGGRWAAFYGAAIADLTMEQALTATKSLFATERFCPTPQHLVDTALGQSGEKALEALGALRSALQSGNTAIAGPARRAALSVWGTLDGVPLSGPIPRHSTEAFIDAWRRETTAARHRADNNRALTAANPPLSITGE